VREGNDLAEMGMGMRENRPMGRRVGGRIREICDWRIDATTESGQCSASLGEGVSEGSGGARQDSASAGATSLPPAVAGEGDGARRRDGSKSKENGPRTKEMDANRSGSLFGRAF
jgi:hypothetical protein